MVYQLNTDKIKLLKNMNFSNFVIIFTNILYILRILKPDGILNSYDIAINILKLIFCICSIIALFFVEFPFKYPSVIIIILLISFTISYIISIKKIKIELLNNIVFACLFGSAILLYLTLYIANITIILGFLFKKTPIKATIKD